MIKKNIGRPKIENKEEKKEKKVMLSFTQKEYEDLKKMQTLLNQATLTATILLFMNKGMEAVRNEFVNIR